MGAADHGAGAPLDRPAEDPDVERSANRKVLTRLVLFLCLLMFFVVMDRVNVGFASLGMNRDIGIRATELGFAAGLFSLGYLLFEIPSNLVLQRVGARKWLSRIMVTTGIVSMASCLSVGPVTFYLLRFLLGVAEAGFLPGVMFLLGQFVVQRHRGRVNAVFLLSMPLGQVLAATLSGLVLEMDGVGGLAGWRWLFLIEGLLPVVLGIAALFYLCDGPADAPWLNEAERRWLLDARAREAEQLQVMGHASTLDILKSRPLQILSAAYFTLNMVLTAVPLWMPQIVRGFGFGYTLSGIVAALPPLVGAGVMVVISSHSDRHHDRTRHLIFALGLTCAGWLIAAASLRVPALAVTGLVLANAGILGANSLFWTLPARYVIGRPAALAIAAISAIGNLGAVFGPILMGVIRDAKADFSASLLFIAIVALLPLPALLLLRSRSPARESFRPPAPLPR